MKKEKKQKVDSSAMLKALRELLSLLPSDPTEPVETSFSTRKKLRQEIETAITSLSSFARSLDPVAAPEFVFDPSDPHVIGQLIARTLLAQPKLPLIGLQKFYGSGVYAIYYRGSFSAYAPVKGSEVPLYVGKVDPESQNASSVEAQGPKLWGRLVADHAKNIGMATNLDVKDFDCRYLVVKSAWQNTAETYLIDWFHPVWNSESKVCFGLGKHGDKASTRANTRSPWDELHPGRPWAKDSRPNPLGVKGILASIAAHFAKHSPKPIAF